MVVINAIVDINKDGRLDLQLRFRRQDSILDQTYGQLLFEDHDEDGNPGVRR